ncbi:coiled-coil domain-containing protein 103 isoform X1 [Falco biarmicus]|uniref:coiled-coil domain-containing protein 103 isoform X1 n=1 Tax=Falco rusticolus TaxID=120794 RepID=UPI0006B784F9|nr:coiled-coil domain-containing protein 103 isoform X1 [Falco rusticolus]XP_037267480.1 coiled-coil domain-containing protein 103 isoform X1 [Falco rusticolus]XP_056218348.1 coiled-coil domain-containing protein 103 isoform X1 [Falco biarmicus]
MEAMEADGALSPGALERELQAAVAADERQARENEAKLRALRQRVPSYEEFRDIVLASHLKPLEKKDKVGKRRNVLWNPCATHTKAPQASNVEIPQELDQLPGTSAEFYRDWRRCLKSRKEKYQFLLELGGKALGRIFQADLGFGLLGEFLMVLAENVCHEDRDAILQILESLSGTKRFGLNVDLLSESEKESSRDLFRKLWSMTRNDWTAGHPSSPAGCEPEREAHLTDTSLQKEAEQERMVMDLMKHYQAN